VFAGAIRRRFPILVNMNGSQLTVRPCDTGHGVFATASIPADSDLIRYHGPLLRYAQTSPETLAVQVGPDLYLGASGGPDDFVNHSCSPNAGLVIVGEDGADVRLVALRDIKPGEQVTFDYSTTMDEDDFEFDCRCGAAGCRGRMRDFKHLPAELKQRYAERGVVPAYNLRYVGQEQDMQPRQTYPFDPTHGYTEDMLMAVGCPPAPADFADFWRATFTAASDVPARASRRVVRRSAKQLVEEVEFDAWGGDGQPAVRLGGWLTTPLDGVVTSGLVVGHGYGGRTAPDPAPLVPGAAVLYPCARGFNRSAQPDIPATANEHVLHGIGSRDTYVHRFNAADLWASASALTELVPAVAANLCYAGASFGGGIGALMLPWDGRYKRAFLDYPSFGHHPIRLTLPCVGSGEAIRQHGGERHLPVLRYFDAATAAAHLTTPTLVAAALYDPAVPPPGQFAIYNCLAGERALFVRRNAHVAKVGVATVEDRLVEEAALDWLGRP
jgi:cephalosporin-C deacetylase